MFGILVIFLCFSAVSAEEPVCSRYHYEEQTLKKMIMVELLVDKLKADVAETKKTVSGALDDMKSEIAEFMAETKENVYGALAGTKAELKQKFQELHLSVLQDMKQTETKLQNIKDSRDVILFSAKSVKNRSPAAGETLIFQTVIANNGSGYDKGSGIFTAPVGGLYTFTFQLCLANSKFINLEIVVDSVPVLKMRSADDSGPYFSCHSTAVSVIVKDGDRVWVKTGRTNGNALWENDSESWNMFSGNLVHKH